MIVWTVCWNFKPKVSPMAENPIRVNPLRPICRLRLKKTSSPHDAIIPPFLFFVAFVRFAFFIVEFKALLSPRRTWSARREAAPISHRNCEFMCLVAWNMDHTISAAYLSSLFNILWLYFFLLKNQNRVGWNMTDSGIVFHWRKDLKTSSKIQFFYVSSIDFVDIQDCSHIIIKIGRWIK